MEAPLASTQTSSWASEADRFQDPEFHIPPHRADSKWIAGVMRFDAVAVGGFG